MARELVNLTNLNEELQEEVKELPKIRTEFRVSESVVHLLLAFSLVVCWNCSVFLLQESEFLKAMLFML